MSESNKPAQSPPLQKGLHLTPSQVLGSGAPHVSHSDSELAFPRIEASSYDDINEQREDDDNLPSLQHLRLSPASLSTSSIFTETSPTMADMNINESSTTAPIPENLISSPVPRYRRLSNSMPPPSDRTEVLPKDIDSEDSSSDEMESDESSSDDEHFKMLESSTTATTTATTSTKIEAKHENSDENNNKGNKESNDKNKDESLKGPHRDEEDQPQEDGDHDHEQNSENRDQKDSIPAKEPEALPELKPISSDPVSSTATSAVGSLTIETPSGIIPKGANKKKGKMKRPASPMLMPQDLYDYEVYRTKIIYPSTAFDEHGDLDEEIPYTSANEEARDAKKALNMEIEVSQVGSDQAAKRMVRTIERGPHDMVPLSHLKDSDVLMLKSYVVATDLSPESSYALEWTIGTIIRDGDILFAVCAFEDDPAEHAPQQEGERLDAIQKITDRIVELLKKTRLQVHVIIEVLHCKSPKHLLTDIIDYVNPTLVILGSRGRGALKGVLLGSFSKYIVERSSVPVMVARRKLHKPNNKHLKVRLSNNLRSPGLQYADAL